jgi:N-acetylmuramoyl-L-alanine amidase
LKKNLVGRGMSAVAGLFLMAAANPATAAPLPAPAVSAGAVDAAAKPLGAATVAVATVSGSILQARPAASVTMSLVPAVATEAAWLQRNGWPLYALVDRYSTGAQLDEQANCIAVAVYHEARGETLEGQLAVARVIMNRAVSGRYPASWCGVVKQPWQFSFVRNGRMPSVDESSTAWRNALGVTRLAINNAVESVPTDCLWYHANYVAPSWGRRLTRVSQIGAHIFYRA